MPYARRSRTSHQLTPRQLQHLSSLQQRTVPSSVVVSNLPHFQRHSFPCPPPPPPRPTSNASIANNIQLGDAEKVKVVDGKELTQESGGALASFEEGGDRVASRSSSRDSSIAATTPEKVMPAEDVKVEMTQSRPCSKRSDSQTEFQIVQRGAKGNIVLLSNESENAQPIELLSSSAVLSDNTRQEIKEDSGEDEWELLSYDEEDVQGSQTFNVASRLVSASA